MKKLRTLIIALASLFPTSAFAQEAPLSRTEIREDVLSAAAINATKTITADLAIPGRPSIVSGWSKARLAIFYTYSAATAVTVNFFCAVDGTNYARLVSRSDSSGTLTDNLATDSRTTSAANQAYMLEFDVRGCRKARWQFDGTGAGAGDVVTVDLALVTGD